MRKRFFLTGAVVCLLAVNLSVSRVAHAGANVSAPLVSDFSETTSATTTALSPAQLEVELTEAKELLREQTPASASSVALAAFDRTSSEIHLVSLDKDSFLTKGGDFLLRSQRGSELRVHIVRPNGVNT